MTRTLVVLLIWAAVQRSGSAAKSALTFNPNYNPIFAGEDITMSCEPKAKAKDYVWFHNNVRLAFRGERLEIIRAKSENSGNYQCQSADRSKSVAVTLNVVNGRLVLQSPPYVHEGDRLSLKCHHNPNMTAGRSKFSKDGSLLSDWNERPRYKTEDIQMNAAGMYTCTKEIIQDSRVTTDTATATVQVKELFTTPKIKQTPRSKKLTCDTEISSYKPDTELNFRFYKNKELVRIFIPSHEFQIPANLLNTTGNYSCAVTPKYMKLTKRSNEITVSKSAALVQNVPALALSLVSFLFITQS